MTIANLRAASTMATDVGSARSNKDSKSSNSFSDVINLAGSRSVDTKSNQDSAVNSSKANSEVSKTTKPEKVKDDKNVNDNEQSDKVDGKDTVKNNEDTTKVSDSAKDGRDVKDTDESVKDTDVTQQVTDEVVDEEAVDPVIMAIQQIMTLMQKVLGISEENLNSTMQELNLAPEDLLDGENILKVVMANNELSNTMDLFNNEELASEVKDLMNLINQSKEELGVTEVTPEEAKAIVETSSKQFVEATVEEEVVVEEATESEMVEGVKVTVTDERGTNTADDQAEEQSSSRQDLNPKAKGNETATSNVFTQLTQAVTQTTTTTTSYTSAQAVDIINQIVEEIRTVVKADTTSMELQLNPASLGKVNIQVASKEGVITAHITAQTEAARGAIEGQIAVLRENFQNQGLKVEAVEVTINPEGFNEFADQQAFEGEGKEGNSKGKRQINLDDIDLDEEELTEEEAINIDMMQRAGNSVDFTA
ncbi:MAG: flagellar hook-length control protein FliK [Lachnospiraceae bacterium]|nr:flagellar hook-length control protein FliK [Lachnospiraceae bacterium]